ncbi:Undecaprenyl-phosphate N-acetylglucosaminyl 1-phosphate transferase [Enterobacter hormaechei]|uniref:MraY family glycosyltransferase n=1 Tax=Enterobacter hormaechei TaxID=158836 RepID=UPI000F838254|nr:glycosyltransferase family 4 protein [Enterobacter hormaechei]MEA3809193.1 glycosyltransferase family 4 protein [Enterobacter hormaechei]MEA3818364.1 glycosyltransferase family 4 protein [Enterobacter hormaechei]RTN56177.1 glycosyltransferase family 4 protein [Enterobacter hormaechei]VAC28310.1 Undecaprenyl-phosphate N-acetylglucosaminyl 1-phosphate transferase [Enterobacter hormaechei]VAE42667.1 Undecaprenyl-phosphate N-acetylglucosaminyl 1-phosphate transferase [Enterobacter hormaechei]
MLNFGIVIFAFLATCALTWGLRGYAIKHNVIDRPNQRSSHSVPTPRGGGVAIVLTLLVALVWFYFSRVLTLDSFLGLFIPGGIVAIIGFLDDHGHIAARWRLLMHFLASAIGMYFLGNFPVITLFGFELSLSWIGMILGCVYLVWMLNLYNFMDGINGLASAEAITFAACSAVLIAINGYIDAPESIYPLTLALIGAAAGFIVWNFPKAKIFMGDAGSGFLGITIGLMILHIGKVDTHFFIAELCLLGVFIVDATTTLLRRVVGGKKVYEAHASHSYQILARKYGSHVPVTLMAIAVNVLWLFPIAFLIASAKIDGVVGLIVAWLPLLCVALKCGAGVKDKRAM